MNNVVIMNIIIHISGQFHIPYTSVYELYHGVRISEEALYVEACHCYRDVRKSHNTRKIVPITGSEHIP